MATIEKNIRMKKKKGNDVIISYPQTIDENILVDGKTRKLSQKMQDYVPARWNNGVYEVYDGSNWVEGGVGAPDPSGISLPDGRTLTAAISAAETAANNAQQTAQGALDTANGKANASHNHSASDITSGTLAVARIPTGTTSSSVALGNHSHTAGDVGALPTGGGTLTGAVTAHTATDYTTARVRNIYATTSDLTAGSSSLTNGYICFVYE